MSTATAMPLPFSDAEYTQRLASTRERMAAQDIDVQLVFTPENSTWLTGYETIGYSSFQCLVVPRDAPPTLIVRELEMDVARATTWIDAFVAIPDGTAGVDKVLATLRAAGLLGRRIGVEGDSPFLTAATHRDLVTRLAAHGPVVDTTRLVEPGRAVKSTDEVSHIRAACRLVEVGMSNAVAAVAAGVSENTVAVQAYDGMVGGGSGFLAADPIVTSGPRSGLAHTTFGNRTMGTGDTVLIELGACRARYFGALMRTVVIGPPSDMVSRCAAAVQESLERAIDAMRPGVTGREVDAACREVFTRHGLDQFFRKRTGYSVGLAFAPDWGEGHIINLGPHEDQRLEVGMVFHIPPALRVPGELCVGTSETVLVTDGGCEPLTSFATGLQVTST